MAQRSIAYRNIWLQVLIGCLAVLLGIGAAFALLVTREAPPRAEREAVGPLVEVMLAQREDVDIVVRGHGTVEALTRASIVPQVPGRVIDVHDQMVAGGFIPAGETILQIEDDDYQLALDRANADLASAESAEETAEAQIAEADATLADANRELERATRLVEQNAAHLREQERAQLAVDLALAARRRAESERATARSQAAAARVAIRRAEVDLQRTVISLPYDAVVVSEQVSVGQFVSAGQTVGQIYGTEAVEIAVPLEDREVGWLAELPVPTRPRRAEAAASASADDNPLTNLTPLADANITGEFFGRWCEWSGRVVRTEGQMDRQSRMVRVVVRVDDPFGGADVGEIPLMPGAFVNVAMQGRSLQGVIPVPRSAIRGNGSQVWIVEDDQRLRIRDVVIARRERDLVYVQEGISHGEPVITSAIGAVSDGMLVRVLQNADATATDTDADSEPATTEGDDDRS